jgi:hypothetical protein
MALQSLTRRPFGHRCQLLIAGLKRLTPAANTLPQRRTSCRLDLLNSRTPTTAP